MKSVDYGLFALVATIVIVGLWANVHLGVLVPIIVLACPLMMFLMMSGMHGGNGHTGHHHDDHTSRRRPGAWVPSADASSHPVRVRLS